MKGKNRFKKRMMSSLLDVCNCSLVTNWSENEAHGDATLILIILFCFVFMGFI